MEFQGAEVELTSGPVRCCVTGKGPALAPAFAMLCRWGRRRLRGLEGRRGLLEVGWAGGGGGGRSKGNHLTGEKWTRGEAPRSGSSHLINGAALTRLHSPAVRRDASSRLVRRRGRLIDGARRPLTLPPLPLVAHASSF